MSFKDKETEKKYHKEYNKIWYIKNKTRYTKVCKQCGNKYKTRYEKSLYCSNRCFGLSRKKQFICLICGTYFYAQTCKKRIYCSKECAGKNPKIINHLIKLQLKRKNDKEYGEKWNDNLKKANKLADHSASIKRFKELIGDKNPMWKGGITPDYRKIRMTPEYKEWRLKVFKRDNWTCQKCGCRSKKDKEVILQAHHVITFAKLLQGNYLDKIYDISNGITLCLHCHRLTDSYAKNLPRIKD